MTHAATEKPVQKGLLAIQRGERPLGELVVTYTDLHPFHGGLRLTLHGNGKIEQESVRQKAGTPQKAIKQADLKKLLDLLVHLQAWEQKVPERPPVPDESRARLVLQVGSEQSTIWEWYNELEKTNRLLQIRELMKKIAWIK